MKKKYKLIRTIKFILLSLLLIASTSHPAYAKVADYFNRKEGHFVKTGSLKIDIKSPQFVSVTKLKDGRVLYANGTSTAIYNPKTKNFNESGKFLIPILISPDSGILLDNGNVFFAGSVMDPPSYVFGNIICNELFVKNQDVISKYEEFINLPEAEKRNAYKVYSKNNSCLPTKYEIYLKNSEKFKNVLISEFFHRNKALLKQRDVYLSLPEDEKYKIYKKIFQTNPIFKKQYDDYIKLMDDSKKAQLYSPQTGKFELSTGKMEQRKWAPHTTLLKNGQVFIIDNAKQAEIYDPATETFKNVIEMPTEKKCQICQLLTLNDGRVFVSFGSSYTIYDPNTNIYSPSKKLSMTNGCKIIKLQNGNLFVLGNSVQDQHIQETQYKLKNGMNIILENHLKHTGFKDVELFNPTLEKDILLGEINISRGYFDDFTLTELKNGNILIAGGRTLENTKLNDPIKYVRKAEIFTPYLGKSKIIGKINADRIIHKAILLDNGSVLIIGGGYLKSSELFVQNTRLLKER